MSQRPASVTTVMVLTWIVAIVSVLTGVGLLLASDKSLADLGVSGTTATTYGWFQIGYGVIVALVAIGLGHGNNFSRWLVTLLMLVRLVAAIWAIAATGGSNVWAGVVTGGIAVVILALLWNGRANAFFASR